MTARPEGAQLPDPCPRLRRPAASPAAALLLAVVSLCASGGTAPAQTPAPDAPPPDSRDIEALERSAEENRARAESLGQQARELKEQIVTLRGELIDAARRAQDFEDNLSGIEQTLAALQEREARMEAALGQRREQLSSTLGALERIALQPPEALLAAPGSPIDTVRSALLLRVAVPSIEAQAATLRHELVQLASLRAEIDEERQHLSGAAKDLDGQRALLSSLIARKDQLYAEATAEQETARAEAERAAAEAKDLRDLLARLEDEAQRRAEAERAHLAHLAEQARKREEERQAAEAAERAAAEAAAQAARERPESAETQSETQGETQSAALPTVPLSKPENVRPFPAGPDTAALVMPARGRVVRLYGQRDDDGASSKGISISTRAAAQVVAPYDGRIAYAGTFRSYGQILIIEHGGRYHTLLAGVDRIDAVVGQWVLAGEPIGVMSGGSTAAAAGASTSDSAGEAQGHPELYLELRRNGQPINPLPWLAKTSDKVQG